MPENRKDRSVFTGASTAALGALILYAAALVLQTVRWIFELVSTGEDVGAAQWLSDVLSFEYPLGDISIFPGIFWMIVSMAALFLVCRRKRDRKDRRKKAATICGIGFGAYAGVTFSLRFFLVVSACFADPGEDLALRSLLPHVLSDTLGQGFFELAALCVFALALFCTAAFGKYRPLAISLGAVCAYRTVYAAIVCLLKLVSAQTFDAPAFVHMLLLFFAEMLSVTAAVTVSMSRDDEGKEGDL